MNIEISGLPHISQVAYFPFLWGLVSSPAWKWTHHTIPPDMVRHRVGNEESAEWRNDRRNNRTVRTIGWRYRAGGCSRAGRVMPCGKDGRSVGIVLAVLVGTRWHGT
jgi:hypothetical protein